MPQFMPDLALDSMWPGMIAAAILLISDYALTIACASLYQKRVRATIVFEEATRSPLSTSEISMH